MLPVIGRWKRGKHLALFAKMRGMDGVVPKAEGHQYMKVVLILYFNNFLLVEKYVSFLHVDRTAAYGHGSRWRRREYEMKHLNAGIVNMNKHLNKRTSEIIIDGDKRISGSVTMETTNWRSFLSTAIEKRTE